MFAILKAVFSKLASRFASLDARARTQLRASLALRWSRSNAGAPLALTFTAALSLGSPPVRPATVPAAVPALAPSAIEPLAQTACPTSTLPDGDACVRLPRADDDDGLPEAESSSNTHRDRLGRWVVYDEIPRRPDRPADYDAYRYPVPCGTAGSRPCVVSGYDLDRADDLQRRGRRLRQVGHGAVDVLEPRGTPVTSVALEHQQGDAEVIYVGPLFGTTVVTRHTLREGARLRDYVLLFGHLDAPAPGLRPGSSLRDGDLVGFVGDTGSPDIVHLHLEARRLRDGVDAAKLTPSALVDGASTVVCDPRNVLPLR
jgi:murein DD-endopeptidase MepM/ murein hydrolase activator NlpD